MKGGGVMLDPDLAQRAACAAPEHLALVDAAFARQGGPAQRRMEAELCPTCPIWRECLMVAAQNGEFGPWGGTNSRERRRFVKRPDLYNMRDVEHPRSECPSARVSRGGYPVPARTIKEWAVSMGLLPGIRRGSVRREIADAYMAAHELAATS